LSPSANSAIEGVGTDGAAAAADMAVDLGAAGAGRRRRDT